MATTSRRIVGWTATATILISTWEGVSLTAYPDRLANGLPTVCYGATKSEIPGLKVGAKYSAQECKDLLARALPVYNAGINRCIHVQMSEDRRASVVSLAYNIGISATCHSTFVRHLNQHDPNACEYMLVFNKASGHYVRGLALRREDEYKYCTGAA